MRTSIITSILFFMLLLTIGCNAQNTKKQKASSNDTIQNNYPRIEVYSEIDKGDQNSGNQKWTDFNGETVYGGDRDYRPYITRKTYFINKQQKEELLKMSLFYLPYFGKKKENITLDQYFQAVINTDRSPLYNILPKNLTEFNRKKNIDKNYQYYSTLLTYEDSYPFELTVIWLDKDTWFVNDIYYSFNENLNKLMQNGKEGIITEGSFDKFLRLSPIFQYKLTEGFPDIMLPSLNNPVPLDKVVLGIALSPGMPNTKSYRIEIAGDGSILNQGLKSNQKIDQNVLTSILLKAQKLSFTNNNLAPKPFVHDGQTFTVSIWKDGVLHRIEDPDMSNDSSPLTAFIKMVQETFKTMIENS